MIECRKLIRNDPRMRKELAQEDDSFEKLAESARQMTKAVVAERASRSSRDKAVEARLLDNLLKASGNWTRLANKDYVWPITIAESAEALLQQGMHLMSEISETLKAHGSVQIFEAASQAQETMAMLKDIQHGVAGEELWYGSLSDQCTDEEIKHKFETTIGSTPVEGEVNVMPELLALVANLDQDSICQHYLVSKSLCYFSSFSTILDTVFFLQVRSHL